MFKIDTFDIPQAKILPSDNISGMPMYVHGKTEEFDIPGLVVITDIQQRSNWTTGEQYYQITALVSTDKSSEFAQFSERLRTITGLVEKHAQYLAEIKQSDEKLLAFSEQVLAALVQLAQT